MYKGQTVSTTKDKPTEIMKQAFSDLCDKNTPQVFIAVTVDKDMMVNFASYGVDQEGTVDLLNHMLDYIKEHESEDEFGKDDNTTLH